MFLDVSGQQGEHSSLNDLQALHEALLRKGGRKVTTLRVQRDGLSALTIAAPLSVALQHVTSLTASYNKLSTLQGIEAFLSLEFLDLSHNALRVLDAHSTSLLFRLNQLRQCDLSHNEIFLIDLDTANTWNALDNDGNFATSPLGDLTVLNLAYNQLIELPDLRCMPALEELNLEHNRIEYIADADTRLPLVALQSFSIGHNALGSLYNLLPLTVLAETLKVLTLKGNPCMQDPVVANGCAVRAWLLWILPELQIIDDTPLSAEERETASKLFRQRGELSYEAMEVMNNHQSGRLEAYLQKFAFPQNTRSIADVLPGTKKEQNTVSGGEMNLLSQSLGGMTSRLPTAQNCVSSTAASTIRPPSAELVVQMMQKKLKQLSNVVEVLWKESISRRVFATIVLQKHVRGFLTRLSLHPSMQRKCARIRENLRRARHKQSWIHKSQPTEVPIHMGEAQSVRTSYTNNNGNNNRNGSDNKNEYEFLVKKVRRLESLVHQMRGEMDEYRRILYLRENKAAITIQKYYRGFLDRKRWLFLKKRYDEFIASLLPGVAVVQRVCRGYLERVKLFQRCKQFSRLQRLEAEVADLRHTVEEMRLLIEQNMRRQRLERYADPERAMEDIISRHATQRTENVTAVGMTRNDTLLSPSSPVP